MSDEAKVRPSYQAWLDRWPDYAQRTAKGTGKAVTMRFKINVQPDGTAYIAHVGEKGKVDQEPLMRYSLEDAVQALRDTWALAVEMANQPQTPGATDDS